MNSPNTTDYYCPIIQANYNNQWNSRYKHDDRKIEFPRRLESVNHTPTQLDFDSSQNFIVNCNNYVDELES